MLGWEVIPRIPLGNWSISPHGIGIAIGYFVGATLMARRARRTGFDEDHAWNAAVVAVLGAIVGARLAYIIGHREQFRSAVEYLQIYKGGISLMGGLIGGFLAAYLYCRFKKLDFGRLADLGAPGLAIGTAIGRIGDLIIGDHLGKTTDGFWGWEYKGGELISSPPCDTSVYPSASGCIEPGMVVHQTALYDSIWSLVIFLILMRLDRKPRRKGFLVFTWAALYSMGRILTDLTRVDKTWWGTGLTGSQLTAICAFVVAAVGLLMLRRKPAVAPKTVPAAAATEATRAAEVVSPVVTPSPPVDDLPPVETPPTAPAEAVVVDTPPGPPEEIPRPVVDEIPPPPAAVEEIPPPPVEEIPPPPVEEIPPPAEEIPPPVEEVPASAVDETAGALPLERPTGPLEEIPPPDPASPGDEVTLAPVEQIPPPAEEAATAAVDDTSAAPVAESPPPPVEAPSIVPTPEETEARAIQDGAPPSDERAGSTPPATQVLPADPATGTVLSPPEPEFSSEPAAASDADADLRKDSQEP